MPTDKKNKADDCEINRRFITLLHKAAMASTEINQLIVTASDSSSSAV